MKAKFFCIICALLLLATGCSLSREHDCNHLVIGSDAEDVVQIIVDYYVEEGLRETVGGCNADNSPLCGDNALHFDIPKMFGESFSCRVSVVKENGTKITNDNMIIELPFGKKNYELRIITDENGEYSLTKKGE